VSQIGHNQTVDFANVLRMRRCDGLFP
jgi:hypothetical protein